jgi:hypothetical protein
MTTIFTESSYDHCTIIVKSSHVITISRCMSLSLTKNCCQMLLFATRKVVVLSDKSVGLQSEGATILLLKHDNVELHPDQYLGP